MATSRPRVLTFHVVPHFNIASPDGGGPLRLGAVVRDLDVHLHAPLNRARSDQHPVDPDDLLPAVRARGFRATRRQLRSGAFGVWARVLGGGGGAKGAGAGGRRETDSEETVSCDEVVTTWFEPAPAWVSGCLAAGPVDEYLVGSAYRAPLYIVTGLKVAKGLRYSRIDAPKDGAGAGVEVGVDGAGGGGLGVGAGANVSREETNKTEFEVVEDVVVGFRVNRYIYKRKSWFSSDRALEGELVTEGAEMLSDDCQTHSSGKQNQFDEVSISEDIDAKIKAVQEGNEEVTEMWIV